MALVKETAPMMPLVHVGSVAAMVQLMAMLTNGSVPRFLNGTIGAICSQMVPMVSTKP